MSDEIAPAPFIQYNPKVRWVIPERLDQITYIGKDVFAIAHDIYIIFFNYKTNSEHVYVANCPENGDGVDAIAGHRSPMFAFAEKAKHPRIIVAKYPNFIKITELQDDKVTRYKGLCMMECDLIAAFSGFPDYSVTIWSWRTSQRLVAVNTGIVARQQIYMASRTHMLICECHSEGLVVWEVAQCYKKCFLLRRDKKALRSWETNEAKLVGVCWTSEGHLYAIDHKANLYSVVSDGISMVTTIEWSEELEGVNTPCMCAFYNGILIFGPDLCLRVLKKVDKTWKVVSKFIPKDPVERLVSNPTCDMATMWTNSGFVYKITGESEDKIEVNIFTVKQRRITKIQLLAPDYNYFAVMDSNGVIYLHEVATLKLLRMKFIKGKDVSFQTSPVEPLLIIFGEVGDNYGMVLHLFFPHKYTKKVSSICLTHQIVSHVTFSPTGREVVAAAMSAGQIFIFKLSKDHKLTLLRYSTIGRGLADCFLMRVGPTMRCFSLVLVSDKYLIGERIICVNAETGKDNKFAGKMQGPYARLLPASTKDTMVGIPHHSRQFHILKLSGEKGVTITVKMGAIIDSGHEIRHFDGFMNTNAFLTYAYDGSVILRHSSAPEEYDFKFSLSHRYEMGIKMAVIDAQNKVVLHLAGNGTVVCTYLNNEPEKELLLEAPPPSKYEQEGTIRIIDEGAINYHDHQELKRIDQEASDFQQQREEVVKNFKLLQVNLVELLEENIAEPALHQLSLSEFNLHLEAKKERLKQAEWEREEIRLATEARIRAQDKVAAWIKRQCWDTMLAPRVKMFAIFSHYKVENFAVLPSQRDVWPELKQIEALRAIEMEKNYDLFQPWIDYHLDESNNIASPSVPIDVPISMGSLRTSVRAEPSTDRAELSRESVGGAQPHVLSGTMTHHFVDVPQYMIPQTQAFSFLQTHFLEHIVKLNTQKVRMWFNKQFDELVTIKKREVGLVEERNARLRFIIEELNKLSDLRGSFHHLNIAIQTPQWQQEEHVHKLTKVEPEECSIEPYISPSQVVIIPPDPGPKDDFRERALMEMMDGVLEKLWHEEIKKPIPKPQCMLEKEPENFNEDDLRLVFDYEAKVAARNEERDKYRKMLHAEYGKLAQVLNEGIVKFNAKVKELWLTRLKVDSSNGQENLNLMRLRRLNLDRIENDEKLERMRGDIGRLEKEVEDLSGELHEIQDQSTELQAAYEALTVKDKHMEKTFKNHFADLSPIIVEQCYKFFKKRPKWQQRASMTPAVLLELALGVLAAQRPPLLHPDCFEYYKAMDQLDQITNMPPVMDEGLWVTMCKLRRAKTENEIRMRALTQEIAFVESAHSVWSKAIAARRTQLSLLSNKINEHRAQVEFTARNKTIQLVLPAGQVEIVTTGHMSDFEDATLIPRAYIEDINNVILKVGALKLRMMRKQTEFRKVILAKEWEHAQMKMKLRHMEQELYSYQRLKIPKELQRYLKEKELGYTDEHDYMRLEKEMEASKRAVDKVLTEQIHKVEELELKSCALQAQRNKLEDLITSLTVKVSEKRLREDPLEPIRRRRIFKKRMETLMMRGNLIREVQANHSTIVMLQTELELLRLKTYPTLASFRTY